MGQDTYVLRPGGVGAAGRREKGWVLRVHFKKWGRVGFACGYVMCVSGSRLSGNELGRGRGEVEVERRGGGKNKCL